MRRLPVYFLIDLSTSVNYVLEDGVKSIIDKLKYNPQALETVYVSIITFGDSANQLFPLTSISKVGYIYRLDGSTNRSLGCALSLLKNTIGR